MLTTFFRRWFENAQQYLAVGLFLFSSEGIAESVAGQAVGKATEEAKIAATVQPSDYFLQILLSLILILLIIFFAAWLLKRYAHVNGAVNGQLKVLGGLSLGQREKVVLLQVGEEQIVIGVTPTQITTLHTLSKPIEVEEQGVASSRFSARLQEALQASKAMADSKTTPRDKRSTLNS